MKDDPRPSPESLGPTYKENQQLELRWKWKHQSDQRSKR